MVQVYSISTNPYYNKDVIVISGINKISLIPIFAASHYPFKEISGISILKTVKGECSKYPYYIEKIKGILTFTFSKQLSPEIIAEIKELNSWSTNPNISMYLKYLNGVHYYGHRLTNGFDATEAQKMGINVLLQTRLNIVMNAVAGSGKTTTAVNMAIAYKKKYPNAKIGFMAFAKKITIELNHILSPYGIVASTLHANGFANIRRVLGRNLIFNQKKVEQIIRGKLRDWFDVSRLDISEIDKIVEDLNKMVDLYRYYDCKSASDMIRVAEKYVLPIDYDKYPKFVVEIMSLMKNPSNDYKYSKSRILSIIEDKMILKESFGIETYGDNRYKTLPPYMNLMELLEIVIPYIEMLREAKFDNSRQFVIGRMSRDLGSSPKAKQAILIADKFLDILEKSGDIDFTDMLYIAATDDRVKVEYFDLIFVDEAQDLSVISLKLLLKMLKKPYSRFVAVGDIKQAIFGFAGSDSDVFKKLCSLNNTITLPLTVSWRCSEAVVIEAQKFNSLIKASPFAKKGEVRNGLTKEIQKDGWAVLCRNNTPLVSFVYKLIAQKKPAYIMGKDISKNLVSMIERYKSIKDMEAGFEKDLDKLLKKIQKKEQLSVEEAAKHRDYQALVDMQRCVSAVMNNTKCSTIKDVIIEIKSIFTDAENPNDAKKVGIPCMSMHASKGLEFHNVAIIKRELYEITRGRCEAEWQAEQEDNLMYVAITRSMDVLLYITDAEEAEKKVSDKEVKTNAESEVIPVIESTITDDDLATIEEFEKSQKNRLTAKLAKLKK